MNLSFEHNALLMFVKNEKRDLQSRLEVFLKTLGLFPVSSFQDKLILMFHDDRYRNLHDRIKVLVECMEMN